MKAEPHRIGIFGGTFNPVHNGHISIARSFLQSDFIDSLWVLLNPSPPHKPNTKMAPYAARLKMLNAAFSSLENTVISDLEVRLPAPAYTVQTMRYLADTYPRYQFYLCMGKDSFVSFTSWYQWNKILQYCNLLIADRPAGNSEQENREVLKYATFIKHQPVDISSTDVRERISNGVSVADMVPLSVLKIINDKKLYQ